MGAAPPVRTRTSRAESSRMRSQKKAGLAISYANIGLNMAVSLFFTPFLIRSLGDAEYGVYRLIASFGAYLIVLNFGIGTVATRYVARCNALGEGEAKENYLFMTVSLAVLLAAVVALAGWLLHFGIAPLFERGLTAAQIGLAETLYAFIVATTALSVFRDVFAGVIAGDEHFMAANGLASIGLIVRIATLVGLLLLGFKSVAIVATDLGIVVLITVMEILYVRMLLKERLRFHRWDWRDFKDSGTLAGALLLQSIVNQVNMNVDLIILGAIVTVDVTHTLTTYSLALSLFVMYGTLTAAIGKVFAPQAVHMVARDEGPEALTDLVVRVGRYQMMVTGAVIGGFILLGRDFLAVWVGKSYVAAYVPALIVMVPMAIPAMQEVAVAILDAKLKRMVRSLVLVFMAALNVLVSIVLVQRIGYLGAAIGTGLAVLLGHGLVMNVYYHRYIGLNVPRMFAETLRGILPVSVASVLASLPAALLIPNTLLGFAGKVLMFLGVYAALLYWKGLRPEEIDNVFGVFRRIRRGVPVTESVVDDA